MFKKSCHIRQSETFMVERLGEEEKKRKKQGISPPQRKAAHNPQSRHGCCWDPLLIWDEGKNAGKRKKQKERAKNETIKFKEASICRRLAAQFVGVREAAQRLL
jgi:hypothetical protein